MGRKNRADEGQIARDSRDARDHRANLQTPMIGMGTVKPVPGDYDGDGRADAAVFRASQGAWYVQDTTNGFSGTAFGLATDQPVPAVYVR